MFKDTHKENTPSNKTQSFKKYEYETLGDLVLFIQFKKREKHPLRNVTFSKVLG